jgi:hypothetical protein
VETQIRAPGKGVVAEVALLGFAFNMWAWGAAFKHRWVNLALMIYDAFEPVCRAEVAAGNCLVDHVLCCVVASCVAIRACSPSVQWVKQGFCVFVVCVVCRECARAGVLYSACSTVTVAT